MLAILFAFLFALAMAIVLLAIPKFLAPNVPSIDKSTTF